jgi:hypothetical protein
MGIEILREITAVCDAAEIPVLPVKGIVTSRILYDDIAERPIADVDVRFRSRDMARLERAAGAAGWRCLRVARSYRNLTFDFGALSLDAEACVGPPGLCALDVDTMLGRSERCEITPRLHICIPEIHDHAVLLTVNAFKDKIVTATPWAIADLERIVVHRAFRSETFLRRIAQSHTSTLTWIVATWMEAVRGSRPWGAIRAAIEARGQVRRGYAKLFQRQMACAASTSMSLRLLARAGSDAPLMRVAALVTALAWSAEMRLRDFAAKAGF